MATLAFSISANASVTLQECRDKARENYPLVRKYDLIRATKECNVHNASLSWLPRLELGGDGAWLSNVYYGIKYPHLFCMCYSMSGATEGLNRFGITDEVPSFLWLLEGKKTDNLPRLYLECGDKDHVCGQSNRITHEKLEAMGVKHSFSIYNGAHSPLFWRGSLKRMMTIISQTLNPDF